MPKKRLKAIFIAESPPKSGVSFNDLAGRTTEPLFYGLMMSVFGHSFISKAEGLRAFAGAGFVLIDPLDRPVNHLSEREADRLILAEYQAFKEKLVKLAPDKSVPLIILKTNVYKLFADKLRQDGFKVLNDEPIRYPAHYPMAEFVSKVGRLLGTLDSDVRNV